MQAENQRKAAHQETFDLFLFCSECQRKMAHDCIARSSKSEVSFLCVSCNQSISISTIQHLKKEAIWNAFSAMIGLVNMIVNVNLTPFWLACVIHVMKAFHRVRVTIWFRWPNRDVLCLRTRYFMREQAREKKKHSNSSNPMAGSLIQFLALQTFSYMLCCASWSSSHLKSQSKEMNLFCASIRHTLLQRVCSVGNDIQWFVFGCMNGSITKREKFHGSIHMHTLTHNTPFLSLSTSIWYFIYLCCEFITFDNLLTFNRWYRLVCGQRRHFT